MLDELHENSFQLSLRLSIRIGSRLFGEERWRGYAMRKRGQWFEGGRQPGGQSGSCEGRLSWSARSRKIQYRKGERNNLLILSEWNIRSFQTTQEDYWTQSG